MPAENLIEGLYEEHRSIVAALDRANEVSLSAAIDASFRKVLVLSIASYFETQILHMITHLCASVTNGHDVITAFMRNKAIKRQYHTFFDWDGKNANSFFGLFGDGFKEEAKKQIAERGLESAVKSFIELGSIRNQLIHLNFAAQMLDKTAQEIFELYKEAAEFVDFLSSSFSDCAQEKKPSALEG